MLLTYSRHSRVEFGTSYMHVGPCVLKKFEKIGGRCQKIAFYTKMAPKSHLNVPKSHLNVPYGVLMPSTCSYHEYNRLKYQQGFNSKLFWKYLPMRARAPRFTRQIYRNFLGKKEAWPMITMPTCSPHGYYMMTY